MELTLCLCEGRHEMPSDVQGSVFGNAIDPKDIDGMYNVAKERFKGASKVTLYVTGLTVALVECIKVCQDEDIGLVLMHFDRDTGTYYPQVVIREVAGCPFCGAPMHGWYCGNCGSS